MPLNHTHKIAFIHIPKTAGGSIEKALNMYGYCNEGSNFVYKKICYGYIPVTYKNRKTFRAETKVSSLTSHWLALKNSLSKSKRISSSPLQHRTFEYLKENYQINDYFVFSFVRNPVDRMLSAYHWLKLPYDLEVFVNEFLEEFSKKNYYFLPQVEFIQSSDPKRSVDFIGRYENLDTDFRKIKQRLSINIELPKIHGSVSRTGSNKLDISIQKKIEAIYKNDFDYFNY